MRTKSAHIKAFFAISKALMYKYIKSIFCTIAARRAGHKLHQPARTGMADRIHRELAFLPRDRVNDGPVGARRIGDQREGDGMEFLVAFAMRCLAKDNAQVAPSGVKWTPSSRSSIPSTTLANFPEGQIASVQS